MPSSFANSVSPPAAAIRWQASPGVIANIKHGVYWQSNIACNTALNRLFSLTAMAGHNEKSRPIDRALARAKERHGWNQVKFASELSKYGRVVVPQDITNWKKRGMPPEHHETVAKMLGWSVDELLGLKAYGIGGASPTMLVRDEVRFDLTDEERQLIEAYRSASPSRREVFDTLARMPDADSFPRTRRIIEDRADFSRSKPVVDRMGGGKQSARRSKKRSA